MDPNPTTRTFVEDLIRQAASFPPSDVTDAAVSELTSMFPPSGRRIGFGTAGLRSSMTPGPLGMNDLTVAQATQGLARYCSEHRHREGGEGRPLAVVGFDHRSEPNSNLSSRRFAMLTKLVFLEAGFDCVLLDAGRGGGEGGNNDEYVHTPLVAFGVKRLRADVGVMITASHNPKRDNGYKVYWSDAVQIRPPLDVGIAESIERVENLKPWIDYGAALETRRSDCGEEDDACLGLSDPGKTRKLADAYFESIANGGLMSRPQASGSNSPPRIAYTAMHGVRHPWAVRSFDTFHLPSFLAVPSQRYPDSEFPTVPFPNPEEKGALDMAMQFAEENGCDLVFANDPDADRLAVAERCRKTGNWTRFTGDQVGTMMGSWLWESVGKEGKEPVAMCSSAVSSTMLSYIAQVEGFLYCQTLTGFKWIGSKMEELRSEGYRPLFVYEEAIGNAFGDLVSDKDGVCALGVMAELATHVYGKEGRGDLAGHMRGLYERYGEFVSDNGYYFCYDKSATARIFDRMRNGGTYVTHVAGYEVTSIRDLREPAYDSSTPDKRPILLTSKSSPMITTGFKNGCTMQFRGSGTEPKFKYYIEMRGKVGVDGESVSRDLADMCKAVLEELLRPEKNGLVRS